MSKAPVFWQQLSPVHDPRGSIQDDFYLDHLHESPGVEQSLQLHILAPGLTTSNWQQFFPVHLDVGS